MIELLFLALACLARTEQPSAPSPIAGPLRDLPWGQLNFLHTTDTHGWHAGHLQEPSFSADWGDYVSFAKHLRDKADADGSDMLLVDTGDRIEGNGLYDGSHPKGRYTYDIVKEQAIDLVCIGNHELYKANSSDNEFFLTVPNFKDSYLSSDVDIYNPKSDAFEPLAPRFKKFTTKNQGIRILAFGFLFDFAGNANNSKVQPVAETIEEKWFQEALRDRDIDLILVFGHVGLRMPEFQLLFKTIRSVQWDTPIQFFGGHTHVRDYVTYDKKSAGIESGRYMETLGFMSVSGLSTSNKSVNAAATLSFNRRYIDNNLFSMYHHSNTNSSTFPTEHGKNVSSQITSARNDLNLDKTRGCAPRDFWVNRAPFPDKSSIFSLLQDRILPDTVAKSSRVAKDGKKALALTNTGALRFDIFAGPFTRDTEFLVSPFTSGLKYLPDVKYSSAKRVLELLNNEGPVLDSISTELGMPSWTLVPPEQISRKQVIVNENKSDGSWGRTLSTHNHQEFLGQADKTELTPGYTTSDDLGDDGDDTVHAPINFYEVPNCIQAAVGFDIAETGDGEPEAVDLVYNEFIEPWLLLALKYLGERYERGDAGVYLNKTFTDIITEWVQENWACRE